MTEMDELILIQPTKEHESQVMEYRQEHFDYDENHINGSCGLNRYSNYDEWLEKVYSNPIGVPSTSFIVFRKSDNKLIGTISLRHELNEDLANYGGNIGYGIRPSERGKGYGTQQLALVLDFARELKIPRVMISCDKDNPASSKVMIKNSAVFEREYYNEEHNEIIQIYWINLS